ncbi:MAG: V-type ATPase 116kDa subunit family protein [Alistipes sp.]
MAKYDFVLFAAQSDDFIARLRELGLVDITTAGWEPSEADRQLLLDIEGHTKAADCIRLMRGEEGRLLASAKPFASGAEAYDHYVAAAQSAASLHAELARLDKAGTELRPWGEFSVESTRALVERDIVLRYFSTPKNNFDKLEEEWSARYTLSVINRTAATVYFVVVATPNEELTLDAQEMKTPSMDIREVERQTTETQAKLKALDAEFSRVAASEKLLSTHAASLKERLQEVRVEATAHQAADGTLTVMEGWAELETSDRLDALLEEYPNVVYIKSDPAPDDETPVLLRNNWFTHIFELVGNMYARPKYGTMDLTPFFAPFYMLFFGICLNDAGYGAVLVLLGWLLLHKNPQAGMMRQAAWFATLCGVMTILFGGFCGSFFGLNLKEFFPSIPFFDFQGQFFSVALTIGIVQILFGMLLKVVMISATVGFRYAYASLGWLLVLLAGSIAAGLPVLNPAWVIPFFTTSSPAFYAVVGVGAVLMLFFNSPGKNPFFNLGLGVWDTYNNITGILSDVLSYIRLFAIGLSGGILATVFNALADGFVPEGSNIVVRLLVMIPILLIGHGINLFMSCISSFVHPMRLTFVEFYKNAGFEMATRTFEPLRKMEETENQ